MVTIDSEITKRYPELANRFTDLATHYVDQYRANHSLPFVSFLLIQIGKGDRMVAGDGNLLGHGNVGGNAGGNVGGNAGGAMHGQVGMLMLVDPRLYPSGVPSGRWWFPIQIPDRPRILERGILDRYFYLRFGKRLEELGYEPQRNEIDNPDGINEPDSLVMISFCQGIVN